MQHKRDCPKCFGTGKDCVGKPCNYVAPVTHTSGIKRWDDATSTWVEAMLDDLGKQNGKIGNVNLTARKGWFIRDGDQSVHVPSRWNEKEDAWEMVH